MNEMAYAVGKYLNYFTDDFDLFIISNEGNFDNGIELAMIYFDTIDIKAVSEEEMIADLEEVFPYGIQIFKKVAKGVYTYTT